MIWFDLDNSPHVPLFRPVCAELARRKEGYEITARDHAQTKDLLHLWKIPHTMIGEHGGKGRMRKVMNLFRRAGALQRAMAGKKVELAVSHGSRTQLLAAWRMRVPSVLMLDYEYTEARIFNALSTRLLMPVYIPERRLADAGFNTRKVLRYDGFKEHLYLKDFVPDARFRESLGVDEASILVTIRPPSVTGNYHDRRSEELFRQSLRHCAAVERMHCMIVNRTGAERGIIPEEVLKTGRVHLLEKAVDGLQLLWHSDLVISGGGTMNREAALLGVPTYSIFTGRRPYMDEHLQEEGRLTFIGAPAQVSSIPVEKRTKPPAYVPTNTGLASSLADLLVDLKTTLNR